MSDTTVLVETVSVGASHRLLQHSQVHIHTVSLLLVALLHVIRDAALALLASICSTTAAARAVAKHSVMLLKHNGAAVILAHPLAGLPEDCRVTGQPASRQPKSVKAVQAAYTKAAIDIDTTVQQAPRSSCSLQQHLLPPQLPRHRGKLTVLLDLDETLLCTYRLQSDDHALRLVPSNQSLNSSSMPLSTTSACRTSLSSFFSSSLSSRRRRSSSAGASSAGYSVSVSRATKQQLALLGGAAYGSVHWLTFTPNSNSSTAGGQVTLAVFERPGCRQFLAELSEIAEVVLFTAATEAYAQPLVDLLDPHHNIFVSRLFSSSCCRVCGKEGVKDLSGLGRDLSRVVLVDNSPYSFMMQPSNGLPCLPFHGVSTDKQLLGVILPLLQSLSQLHDIRPLLASKFRVKEWLVSKGCQLYPTD